jgi:S1-C subfamily serine protease
MRRASNRSSLFLFTVMAVLLCLICPASARAQDSERRVCRTDYCFHHQDECVALEGQEIDAHRNKQWDRVVALSREYLTVCRDLVDGPEKEAIMLANISFGLNRLQRYEDALPISKRCVALKPDFAECFDDMRESLEGLGRPKEAMNAYKEALAVGGYDKVNASAIDFAKERLAALEKSGAQASEPGITAGSGFFVNGKGYLLTNAHVVSKCKRIQITNGGRLQLVNADEEIDLALLKEEIDRDDDRHPVATFRMPSPRVGDAVIVFGFPLPTILSTAGNLSTGTVAAKTGLRDDPRFIQITAPVQPGNSGGPVLDSGGNVIGVVVAKLDAIKIAQLTGDIPENVNFAIQAFEAIRFLKANHISPAVETWRSVAELKTADVAAKARQFTVAIECVK